VRRLKILIKLCVRGRYKPARRHSEQYTNHCTTDARKYPKMKLSRNVKETQKLIVASSGIRWMSKSLLRATACSCLDYHVCWTNVGVFVTHTWVITKMATPPLYCATQLNTLQWKYTNNVTNVTDVGSHTNNIITIIISLPRSNILLKTNLK